jgi:hypothetical protein
LLAARARCGLFLCLGERHRYPLWLRNQMQATVYVTVSRPPATSFACNHATY